MKKLVGDIKRYSSCGVPSEKMEFWNSLEDSLERMAAGTAVTHPCPLTRLQEMNKITPEAVCREIPAVVTDAIEKDRAPLPEVHRIIGYLVHDFKHTTIVDRGAECTVYIPQAFLSINEMFCVLVGIFCSWSCCCLLLLLQLYMGILHS